ncbi:MAG: hypothetical protein LBO74_03175 [Candidatus Symbiothrix sp.]|nr:hypothetical protein [Candidatus Symbiothrix sp.]
MSRCGNVYICGGNILADVEQRRDSSNDRFDIKYLTESKGSEAAGVSDNTVVGMSWIKNETGPIAPYAWTKTETGTWEGLRWAFPAGGQGAHILTVSGDGTLPGECRHISNNDWNTFVLDNPITIHTDKPLYIGLEVIQHQDIETPLYTDKSAIRKDGKRNAPLFCESFLCRKRLVGSFGRSNGRRNRYSSDSGRQVSYAFAQPCSGFFPSHRICRKRPISILHIRMGTLQTKWVKY